MDTQRFDILVIGGGIAGATVAWHLASRHKVAVLEAESLPGYHTTGRSAAIWIQNYGPPDVQALTGLSRAFFETPPLGFSDVPLAHRRAVAFLAPPEQVARLEEIFATGIGLRPIEIAELCRRVPVLKPSYLAAAGIEEDAFDMDVAALHQGFLAGVKRAGGAVICNARTDRIERVGGIWRVTTTAGAVFEAAKIINAAGAWGDIVAGQAGIAALGLQPKRRTGVIIEPAPHVTWDWPMLRDVHQTWYARPEARTRLMVSPSDETDMDPQDIQPDELDVAIAIDRMQQALDIPVRHIERSWAGLRTFTPDRSLAFGPDAAEPSFIWCVGQGGYGIQTSPAAGALVAALIEGRDPGAPGINISAVDPNRFKSKA